MNVVTITANATGSLFDLGRAIIMALNRIFIEFFFKRLEDICLNVALLLELSI
jgi:hypothetical protein